MTYFCEECREEHPSVCPPKEQWRKLCISIPIWGEKEVLLNPHTNQKIYPGAIECFTCPWCPYPRGFYGTSNRNWPDPYQKASCEVAYLVGEENCSPIPMYPCMSHFCFSRTEESVQNHFLALFNDAHEENRKRDHEKFEAEYKKKEKRWRDERHLEEWNELLAKSRKKITVEIGIREGGANGLYLRGQAMTRKKFAIPAFQVGKVFAIHRMMELYEHESPDTTEDIPYLGSDWVLTHLPTGFSVQKDFFDGEPSLAQIRDLFRFLENGYSEKFAQIKTREDFKRIFPEKELKKMIESFKLLRTQGGMKNDPR